MSGADVLNFELAFAVCVGGVLESGALRNCFSGLTEEDGSPSRGLAVVEDKPSGDGTAGLIQGVVQPLVWPSRFLDPTSLDGVFD